MSIIKLAAMVKTSTADLEKKLEARVQARASAKGGLEVRPARMKIKDGTTMYTSGSKSFKR